MLTKVQEILQQSQFGCSFYPANEVIPFDRLLVLLGKDAKGRERILEVAAQEQEFDQLEKMPSFSSLEQYYRVQFRYLFPFKIKEDCLQQVSSLIHFINQLLDLPGLELNELENEVAYRYVWLVKTGSIDSKLVLSLIGTIMLVLEMFTQTIECLADGTTTFNALLEEIIKIAEGTQKSY